MGCSHVGKRERVHDRMDQKRKQIGKKNKDKQESVKYLVGTLLKEMREKKRQGATNLPTPFLVVTYRRLKPTTRRPQRVLRPPFVPQ